jgi:hypothetical protein
MKVEEQIRRALTSDRYAVPGWTEPIQRIESGVRRRRRRRLIGASSALAVLAGGVFGLSTVWPGAAPSANTSQTAGDQPIAWIDKQVAQPTNIARRSPRTDARKCSAADLGSKAWTDGKLGGNEPLWVLIGNSSDSRCTLDGSAKIVARDAGGKQVTVPTGSALAATDAMQYPATVDPGEPARFALTMQQCDKPTTFRNPALVALGREIPIPSLSEIKACSVSTGRWAVRPPALNADSQLVTLDVPAEVRKGERLKYTITLLNPSESSLSLKPCPVYIQSLGGSARAYQLNCVEPELGAHESLRFAMEYAVPADAPAGKATLAWTAVFADGTVAIADASTGGASVQVKP